MWIPDLDLKMGIQTLGEVRVDGVYSRRMMGARKSWVLNAGEE